MVVFCVNKKSPWKAERSRITRTIRGVSRELGLAGRIAAALALAERRAAARCKSQRRCPPLAGAGPGRGALQGACSCCRPPLPAPGLVDDRQSRIANLASDWAKRLPADLAYARLPRAGGGNAVTRSRCLLVFSQRVCGRESN